MTALRTTLRQERPTRPVVCLVRFEDEAKSTHRATRSPSAAAHGVGVTLEVRHGRAWLRCEIVSKDEWAIVVRPV